MNYSYDKRFFVENWMFDFMNGMLETRGLAIRGLFDKLWDEKMCYELGYQEKRPLWFKVRRVVGQVYDEVKDDPLMGERKRRWTATKRVYESYQRWRTPR